MIHEPPSTPKPIELMNNINQAKTARCPLHPKLTRFQTYIYPKVPGSLLYAPVTFAGFRPDAPEKRPAVAQTLVRTLCLGCFVVRLLQFILDSCRSLADTLTIKSLDGLRGLAVLLVLLSHMSNAQMHLLPFLDFSGLGKAGVYLFFSLSAFLLTWQALKQAQQAPDPKYWLAYLLRRALRIYPLYALALTVSHL